MVQVERGVQSGRKQALMPGKDDVYRPFSKVMEAVSKGPAAERFLGLLSCLQVTQKNPGMQFSADTTHVGWAFG